MMLLWEQVGAVPQLMVLLWVQSGAVPQLMVLLWVQAGAVPHLMELLLMWLWVQADRLLTRKQYPVPAKTVCAPQAEQRKLVTPVGIIKVYKHLMGCIGQSSWL